MKNNLQYDTSKKMFISAGISIPVVQKEIDNSNLHNNDNELICSQGICKVIWKPGKKSVSALN